ncbi:MAG: GGDEF domain-containing protein [Capsulimonas sp.]|uniref:GGDEF domain-containing protein n=1 Tax=Capsulimonas sp. TaxID=2494211 RepID=UPI0032656A10
MEIALKISEERARLAHIDLMIAKGELEAEQEKLRKLATEDNLTGLWNRRMIFEHLAGDLTDAKQTKRSISVVMADVDGFKQINDRHGHQLGDVVLQETAKRFKASVRTSDAVGRYGGEEFLIVFHDCDGEAAMLRAEQLRLAINKSPIFLLEGKIDVTCSFGVSWTRDGYYDIEQIVREADTALYRAKHTGKNKVEAAPIEYQFVS